MVPVLNIVRGSVTENFQVVAENLQENLHTVSAQVATVQRAVAHDMRALWEGAEANFHEIAAANEPPVTADDAAVDDRWRLPLGWISLAAGTAVIAGLGLAQVQVRERRQAPAAERHQPRGLAKKALRRGKMAVGRTDWSKSG